MHLHDSKRDLIAALFPDWVAFALADSDRPCANLSPEEEAFVAGATQKRRREFCAGRFCAREALAGLGVRITSLPASVDRYPLWPVGVVGSISHCSSYAVAAVARREQAASLGIDMERVGGLGEHLLRDIATPGERRHLEELDGLSGADWNTLLFSAKESFYKCYYPLAREVLEFDDVAIRFNAERRTFEARLTNPDRPGFAGQRSITGGFVFDTDHVATAVVAVRASSSAPATVSPRTRR